MTVAQASRRESAIRYVKGVGPRRAAQLLQLGIETVEDACYYPPRRYEDRTRLSSIREAAPGAWTTIRGRILARSLRRLPKGHTLFELAVGDVSGVLYAKWFNQAYLAQQWHVGDEMILYGQVEPGTRAQMMHPEMERVEQEAADRGVGLHMGRIVPIYSLVGGMSQRWLRQILATVLERYADEVSEWLPEDVRAAHGWPGLARALRELHFPTSWEALEAAKQRLAFQELFMLQLVLAQRRAKVAAIAKPRRYDLDGPLIEGLRRQLPFSLTASQQRVVAELCEDLRHPYPMQRLLQGDVGCGKTVVVAWLMAIAVQSGYQVALMAPTELLAEQHARVVGQWLGPLGVSVGMLTQGVPAAERAQRLTDLAQGRLQVVIGTHALIQRSVTFQRLALVVIDEQHKFGVLQRARLAQKAEAPDVLVLTATPIPRTLALSLYGDLAISTITELPPGRRPVTTRWMREAQRQHVYAMVREQIIQGRQGYVVYPLVEERAAQGKGLKAATQMAGQLQREMFSDVRVGLLHGQMKPAKKEQVMREFARGAIHLLVSTVIVEVGLDIPNATIMVIEHPERFGLAQLHQLRGRIGRGSHPATCIALSETREQAAVARLSAFLNTTDGFALAEQDLKQRGPGYLLGRQQHGWWRLRIADMARDHELLELGRQEAMTLVDRDPHLQHPSLGELRDRLAQFRRQAA